MFFGLTNSLAIFQTMMDNIYKGLISERKVIVYLDNLIFTETPEEHQELVKKVVSLLHIHNIFLKLEKCEFEHMEIEYLGVIISHNSICMDPVKVAGVSEWPIPSNKKEVQLFRLHYLLLMVHWDFSHHAQPLFDLTKNNTVWRWGSKEQAALDLLKERITSAPVLVLSEDSWPFCIEADSSDFATGAILSQQSPEDGKWHPVAFLSKSLLSIKQNYKIHDMEMLAIIQAMEEWRHFLEGAEHQFEIWTDHKNLEYFMKAKKLNCRQAHWSLLLAYFNFVMHHQPGKSMGKSDALSCWVVIRLKIGMVINWVTLKSTPTNQH